MHTTSTDTAATTECLNRFLPNYVIMLYSNRCYGDAFEFLSFIFFIFFYRNYGTAMAVLAAPLPAALIITVSVPILFENY